ncbi:MAG: CAP domain-containing protein [Candidatus Velamenicoccus archaeovorus]
MGDAGGAHRLTAPRRFAAALLVATVLVALLATPAPASASSFRSRLLTMLNRSREANGVRPVKLNLRLSDTARAHSRRMVQRGELFDIPSLSQALAPFRWSWGGSVVGCGTTLWDVHRGLMNHAPHRTILMGAKARWVGIGVVRVSGKSSCGRRAFWVTEILYG